MKISVDNILTMVVLQFLIQSFIFLAIFQGLSIQVWEEKSGLFDPVLFNYIQFGYFAAIPMLAFSTIILIVRLIPNKKKSVSP